MISEKPIQYRESHPLRLNVYLLFYIYIILVFIMANLLPVRPVNYFIFLFLGILAVFILIIKFSYCICIQKNFLVLYIKIPFKLILFKVSLADIKGMEETQLARINFPLSLRKKEESIYFFEEGGALCLTLHNGKVITISGVDGRECISQIKKTWQGDIQLS